ncbi:MAG: glycosyltransferase family 4 protein [candidate division WOR-3 bacterium]|nr:MAG: glycosyltransferase family 4 protein [candidate division WOR-3 bacterium]
MCTPSRKNGVRHPKLLFIHQNFVTPHQAGNCSRPAITIATLLSRGWTVDVITTQFGYLNDSTAEKMPDYVIEKEGDLTIHRLRVDSGGSQLWKRGRFYMDFLLKAFLYMHKFKDVDIIFTASPPILQIFASMLFSVWHNKPMMLEVHDLWPARLVDNKLLTSSAVIVMMEWLEALMYHYADHLIPISPTYRPYLMRMGIPSKKISVIPTGGSQTYVLNKANYGKRWRNKHSLQGKFLLLYAGSFNESYELKVIIDAAYDIARIDPNIQWIFAGNGRQRHIIEEASQELHTIHYIGCIPSNELMQVYLSADVGLNTFVRNPQNEINIPGKLFDYLAAGLPVISLINGLSGVILSAAKAGFVLKHCSKDDMVSAVLKLKRMPQKKRQLLGKSGQRWVLKNMNDIALWHEAWPIFVAVNGRRTYVPRFLRFTSSAITAWKDTTRRRSRKSIRQLFTEDRQYNIESTLNDWLRKHSTSSSTPMKVTRPKLLSV